MTEAQIIELAREAGLLAGADMASDRNRLFAAGLVNFAELVAAAERRKHQADIERWKAKAVTAEKWRGLAISRDGDGRSVQTLWAEAAAAEREACALVAEDWQTAIHDPRYECDCATAIRARGGQQ